MERIAITEEQGIHKEWYEKASKQTLNTLPEFISRIMDGYEHDYGTICHAFTACGIATMWAMNKEPQGGITGFQAGAIMWEFIRNWNYTDNKCGMKLIDYDKLLFPQYEDSFQKTISKSVWSKVQDQANKFLEESDRGHKDVRNHWASIANGIVPFGYTVIED